MTDYSTHKEAKMAPSTYAGNKSTTNWSQSMDDADDKKKGVKEDSKQDKALDKKRGVK